MPKDKTDTHVRIIDAAKKEFLAYGYNDASLRRIAACAQIRVSGLYKHFSSKEELFATLVEPAVQAFNQLYENVKNAYFTGLQQTIEDFQWESKDEVYRCMECIYDHLDEFKLLVLRSEGTRFEHFVHDIARLEEEVTLRYIDELKARGCRIRDIDPTEMHLLNSAYVESVFQPVIHGLDRDKALHFAITLQEFYKIAWKSYFGI